MDSLDLLAREEEFRRLNKQLEKKTESLMKEIEHAMQKRDIFSEFSPSLALSPVHTIKKHACDIQATPEQTPVRQKQKIKNITLSKKVGHELATVNTEKKCNDDIKYGGSLENGGYIKLKEIEKNGLVCDFCVNRNNLDDKEFLYAFVSVNVKEKVLPECFLKERPTVETLCKFLSSKVKLMQEQIEKQQSTLNKKNSQCNSHLNQLAELESERMTLLNQCNTMKCRTADMKAKCMATQQRFEEKDKLYIEQRSMCDKLSCELKQYRTKNLSLEAKCANLLQSIDNLNQQLDAAKKSEKEFRECTRSLSSSNQSAISRLESQLKAQASRIDKQMALIDNLRRQNVLLSTEASVKALEKEYCDYLQKDF